MKTRIALFLVVACTIMVPLSIVNSEPPSPGKGESHQQHNNATDEQRSPSQQEVQPGENKPPLKISPTAAPEKEAKDSKAKQQEKKTPDDWWFNPDWWMVGVTSVIMVLLGAHAVIFFRQSTATEIAANAAKKSADHQESSMLRTERAYIIAKVPITIALDNGLRVRIAVINAGKTYGTVERLVCRLVRFPAGKLPNTPSYSGFIETFPQLPIAETPVFIGEDQISSPELPPPSNHLFFIGYFEYTDISDKTHHTRFCWFMQNDDAASNGWRFERAGGKTYNNTYDEPPKEP